MKILLIAIFIFLSLASQINKPVLLGDVNVITLHKGQQTTYRRTSPILQLNCVGGSAFKESYKVTTVQCKNMGFNGKDYDWKCESQLESHLKLGKAVVSCEGYNYPDDPYILVGSCGLEYTLDYNDNHKTPQTIKHTTIHTKQITKHPMLLDVLMLSVLMIFIVICVLCLCNCCTVHSTSPSSCNYIDPYAPQCPTTTYPVTQCSATTYSTPRSPNVVIVEKERPSTSAFVDGVVMGTVLSQRPTPTPIYPSSTTYTSTTSYPSESDTLYTSYSSTNTSYPSESNNINASTTYAETKRR